MFLLRAALLSALSIQILRSENVTTMIPAMFTNAKNEELNAPDAARTIEKSSSMPTNISSSASETAQGRIIQERTVLDFFALQHRLIQAVYGM